MAPSQPPASPPASPWSVIHTAAWLGVALWLGAFLTFYLRIWACAVH